MSEQSTEDTASSGSTDNLTQIKIDPAALKAERSSHEFGELQEIIFSLNCAHDFIEMETQIDMLFIFVQTKSISMCKLPIMQNGIIKGPVQNLYFVTNCMGPFLHTRKRFISNSQLLITLSS